MKRDNLDGIRTRIRMLLDMNGWSQRELSRRAGLSGTHVSALLAGTTPTLETAGAIARAAGVSLEWLCYGRGPKSRKRRPSVNA